MVNCDATDARILEALLADGRASLRSVAGRIDVTATTVSERLADLEERGVVRGFAPRIDYGAMGYQTAILRLWFAGGSEDTLDRICERPELTTIHRTAGGPDAYAIGRFVSLDGLGTCLGSLRELRGVDRVAANVVLATPVSGRSPPFPD